MFAFLTLGWLASCESKTEVAGNGEEAVEWVGTASDDWQEIGFGGEGAARWESGVLSLDAGVELTGVRFVGEALPERPYELELEARKVMGTDFFCGLTFPVSSKEECVTFIVGGWGGGTVGISSIDGQDASENETTTYGNFEVGKWYGIRVRVEDERLVVFLEGEKVADVATSGHQLALRPGVIEACAPLGLAAFQTAAEVRGLRWRSLAD